MYCDFWVFATIIASHPWWPFGLLNPIESGHELIGIEENRGCQDLMTPGLTGCPRKGVLNRMRWILTVVAGLLVFGGCAPESVDDSSHPTPLPTQEVREVPHPILDDMEPMVATELAARRAELDDLLREEAEPDALKGRALGRMGQLYQAHRLLEVAEACYREAQLRDPQSHAWPYYRGVLAAGRGDLATAGAALEKAVALAPGDVPAKIRLADLELDLGHIEIALALYEEARSLDESLAAVEYGLGRVAAEHGDFQKAVWHFNKALALQPRASIIHYHLGQSHRQLGQIDQARNHLSRSGQMKVAMPDPLLHELTTLMRGASPHLTRGNAALREGRFVAGAAEYRRAVEADPTNLRARQSLATTLLRLNDLQGALEQFAAAVELAPENARARSDYGVVLAEAGQDERAIQHLRIAVELEPELKKAQFNLANALARGGDFEAAVARYRRLLEVDPDHLEARSRLGTALAQAGRLDEGIVELRGVVERDPKGTRARLNLGVALAEAGDLEGAIAQHLAILDLNPDPQQLALIHFNLGTFYKRTGDLDRAMEHHRRAIELDPQNAAAHFDLGEILSANDRLAESLVHYSRAGEIRPTYDVARLREATTLMRLERYADAKRVLEEGLARIPGDRRLAHALARLLAASPDRSLRDGRRSFSMAAEIFNAERVPRYAETLAMALAEVGRFDDGRQLQQRVLVELERSAPREELERLRRNLDRYAGGVTCCATPSDVLP